MIKVFNIERFATHDGPGIRTVVFLKGCPLRCPWCANPESQSIKPVLLYDKRKCIHCYACVKSCPMHAISFANDEFVYDEKKCENHQACVEVCPTGALSVAGEDKALDDIVNEVMKDIDYYDASNGGVTISGGEPFVQFPSLLALVKRFKAKNLHVAIETCGNFSNEYIKKIDDYVDLYLFDLKHVDPEAYEEVCGGDINVVKKNLESIDPKKVVVRVPVIPSFNYQQEVLERLLQYVSTLHIEEIHFLPYHELGKSKYERMGKPYLLNEKPLHKEDLYMYKDIAKKYDINLRIGG